MAISTAMEEFLNGLKGTTAVGPSTCQMDIALFKKVMKELAASQLPLLIITDEKASGTNGGSSGAATQNTRPLNSVKKNTIEGASLAANQITLPAGTYAVDGWCAFFRTGQTKARIQDITGGASLVIGASVFGQTAAGSPSTLAFLNGEFTIDIESVIEFQMFSTIAQAGSGLGRATFSGDVEIYSYIRFIKLD